MELRWGCLPRGRGGEGRPSGSASPPPNFTGPPPATGSWTRGPASRAGARSPEGGSTPLPLRGVPRSEAKGSTPPLELRVPHGGGGTGVWRWIAGAGRAGARPAPPGPTQAPPPDNGGVRSPFPDKRTHGWMGRQTLIRSQDSHGGWGVGRVGSSFAGGGGRRLSGGAADVGAPEAEDEGLQRRAVPAAAHCPY